MESILTQIKEEANGLCTKLEQCNSDDDDDFIDYVVRQIGLLQSYIDLCNLSQSISFAKHEALTDFKK